MIEEIKLWWKFEGRYYYPNFINGLKNLWRWLPTIWRDRDWDHSFIYSILAKKLEFQADYMNRKSRHLNSRRDAEKVKLVAKLIRLHQEDFYGTEYTDYHQTDYDFVPTDETKKWFRMETTLVSENFDDYFKKYPRQYRRVINGEVNHFIKTSEDLQDKKLIALTIAHENEIRCKKLIFTIMHDNIDFWWD